jgi:hypothetical protein
MSKGRSNFFRGIELVRDRVTREYCQFPEHGVHHARRVAFLRLLQQLNAVVDDCVRGHAIQMQQLKCAQAERGCCFHAQLYVGTSQQSANSFVERQLPAQRSQHQHGGQVAILRGERIDLRCAQ